MCCCCISLWQRHIEQVRNSILHPRFSGGFRVRSPKNQKPTCCNEPTTHNPQRTTMTAPTPYQPPLALPTLQHIALASKSYRVFGLPSEAWQIARHDLKKRCENENGQEENEDYFEMMEICTAVCTALQEDAGGYGTVGFHLVSLC